MHQEVVLFESQDLFEKRISQSKGVLFDYEGKKYCLKQNGKSLFVTESHCPHFDYPLLDAPINSINQLVCPWHGYKFDLKTGLESARRCRPVKVFSAYWNDVGQLVAQI